MAKKYASLTTLQTLVSNIKSRFATKAELNEKSNVQMITTSETDSTIEHLPTLKIYRLTQEQYEEKLANNDIDETALYITPDEEGYTQIQIDEILSGKANVIHNHSIEDVTNLQNKLDSKVPTSRTINNKPLTANITLSASDVGASASGHNHDDRYYTETEIDTKLGGKSDTTHNHDTKYEAKNSVSTHNTSTTAHSDIRDLITGLTTRLNTLANSDDTTLDQMSEIVAYIKNNKSLIDSVTTNKVNVADIVNNLTTNVTNKPLSAAQGVEIKRLIDALDSALDTHDANATKHITSTERNNWNAAKTHADSAHAPSNAQPNQNAFSNIKVGSTTIAADTTTDTLTLEGSNVTITPDATNDKVTIAVADATTSAKGVVQLTDSVTSTSTTTAATPKNVKAAYDLANTAKTNAATAQSKADSAYTLAESKVDSLSDLGITATASELNYMGGVTSNVQSQLDSKADTSTLIGRAGEGNGAEIFNDYDSNTASGRQAHAEGYDTTASGMRSHAEGQSSTASAQATHAEGYNTQATATAAHSEGYYTEATGKYSHAEGYMSKTQEQYAHAEGYSNTASGEASHAEGYSTWADGNSSHTEGCYTTASGDYSHAEGFYVEAAGRYQHVQGKYNIVDEDSSGNPLDTYAHIVGNGTANTKRSNAHTIDWDGNAWFAGDICVGGTSQNDSNASKVITKADQRWNLLYDSGEISAIANSISNIDVSGYTNIQVLVRCYNDGDSINSRAGSAIFTCTNGKTYQFPVWSNMFSKSINTVYTMATFNLVDGWLVCPYASRLIGDASTFEDEGGTAGNLSLTGSGMMKCTSQLSTLTISNLDQNSNYYFGMGSRVMVWGWNA